MEYTESIDGVSECIAALKKHAHDAGQADAALAQEEKHEEAVQSATYEQVWDDVDMADDEEEDMCWNGDMKAQMKAGQKQRGTKEDNEIVDILQADYMPMTPRPSQLYLPFTGEWIEKRQKE